MIRQAGSMRPLTCAAVLLPAALLLAGCQKDTDPGPGGVTVGEARALDEAAEMLEKRPAPPRADAVMPAETGQAEPIATPPATPNP